MIEAVHTRRCLRGVHRRNFTFHLYPQIILGVLTRYIFVTVKYNYKNKGGQHTWHLLRTNFWVHLGPRRDGVAVVGSLYDRILKCSRNILGLFEP